MHHTVLLRIMQVIILLVTNALLLQVEAQASAPGDAIPANISGEITVLYTDDFSNKRAELQYFIEEKQSKRRFRLYFDDTPPGHLRTGMSVTVRGKAKGRDVFLAADGVDSSNTETVLPATVAVSGEQKTIVIAANFGDASLSCSSDAIRDLMFTDPEDKSIDDLYQETSHGNIWLTGQVVGPFNINHSSSTCDYSAWSQAADDAARASGFNPDAYDRKVYVLPQNACPAAGIGTVGGNPSRSWIFYCNIADIYGHELGHNLGMHHASTPSSEYGDNSDIMGIGQNRLRQINAPHKEQMGWLPGMKIEMINQSGYYDIAPLELDPAAALAPQTLKIAKPDTNEYYYLSYRRGIGFDANLSSSLYLDRLSVHRYPGDGSSSKTRLLALPTDGESFTDAVNGITVTQLSHHDDYVTVEVNLNGTEPTPTCSANSPQLSITPSSQSATAGTSLNFSIHLTNQDSTACANSTFALNDTIPAGWAGTVSPASLSLDPGQIGTATLSVTSASSASANTYSLVVNVTDNGETAHTTTDSASYTVVASCSPAAPTLSVSPASQSGDPGTTRIYSVSLANNDSNACGASTFSLSRIVPGWSNSLSPGTLTLSPGESGVATLQVTSPTSAGPGSYALQVEANDSLVQEHSALANATYIVNETIPAGDTEAPTAPSGLVASSNSRQVNLSWSPSSDNVAVTGYLVYRNGVMIADTPDTGYNDRDGLNNIVYSYSVVAYDLAENFSAESATVEAGKMKANTKGSDGGSGGTKGKGRLK